MTRLVAVAVAIGLIPGVARAEISAALTGIELGGELADVDASEFEAALTSALVSGGLHVASPAEIAAATGRSGPAVEACADAACLEWLLEGVDAQVAIRVGVEGSLNMYSLTMTALGPDGSRLATIEGTCDLCTRDELVEAIATHGEELAQALPRGATLILDVTPADAVVTLDGEAVEPPEVSTTPGHHRLMASAEGYQPLERDLALSLGQVLEVDLDLRALEITQPPEEGPSDAPRRLGPLGIAGVVTSATSALGFVAASVLLAVDRTCVAGSRIDDFGQCELIYETTLGGALTMALSGAALVSGVVMLVFDLIRRRSPTRGTDSAAQAAEN